MSNAFRVPQNEDDDERNGETDQLLTDNQREDAALVGFTHEVYTDADDADDTDDEYNGARNAQLSTLYFICSKDQEEEPQMWDQVRKWIKDHVNAPEDIKDATALQGMYGITPLHLICRNDAPMDIARTLVNAAPHALELVDTHGWLPLHYAAVNGSNTEMIKLVVEAFPGAVDVGDNQGRVPLHFALSSCAEEITFECAKYLVSTAAASCKDDNDMSAMHYVCKYGASVEILEIVAEVCGDSDENPVDKSGRIPLHYTCYNPNNAASPDLTAFILDMYPESVNIFDNYGNLPLRLLAIKVKASEEQYAIEEALRERPEKILDLYLKVKPNATADFLTALQALPEWLRDRAVMTATVQDILNRKISKRFPTAILMIDFVLYVAIIVSFSLCVPCSIQLRTYIALPPPANTKSALASAGLDMLSDKCTDENDTHIYVYVLAGCSCYFLFRELAQVLSLMALGQFKTWLFDLTNWLDVITIGSGLYFAGDMYSNFSDLRRFRWMASVTLLLFWSALLSFLKSTFIEFSVFVGGLSNVLNRLLAFLTALFIILMSFTVIFVMIYFDSSVCTCAGMECGEDYSKFDHFCTPKDSFLKVYTMLLGEVDEENFLVNSEDEKFTQSLGISFFSIFMLLVVILLANVLIAIVTDSYGVIKNERAAIVFWSNRLDFIAEIDAIKAGPWKSRKFQKSVFSSEGAEKKQNYRLLHDTWESLTVELFMWDDMTLFSFEFIVYLILRGFILCFIVLLWLPIGLLTAGTLWPPQVRQWIFVQTHDKQRSGEKKELEKRSNEVKALKSEVIELQDEIVHELCADRMEVVALKSQMGDMKNDLKTEMKEIKTIVSTLFEMQVT